MQKFLETKFKSSSELDSDGTYYKTELNIVFENNLGEEFSTSPRLDIANNRGDFNPFMKDVLDYLKEDLGYNVENVRNTNNSYIDYYVDLSDWKNTDKTLEAQKADLESFLEENQQDVEIETIQKLG